MKPIEALRGNLLAAAIYAAFASIYFGIGILNHLSTCYVGHQTDPALFTWMLNWWQFALAQEPAHPLFSHYLWQPVGVSIANTTSIPSLGIATMWITKRFGANVSYNLLAIYAPALSAWSMYWLARYLKQNWPGALISGLLFGFSTYMIGQTLGGHINLTSLFCLPLLILCSLAFYDGKLNGLITGLLLIALWTIQFGISEETLLACLFVGIVWWITTCILCRYNSIKLIVLLTLHIVALGLMMVIVFPDWWQFIHFHHMHDYAHSKLLFAQPLNLITPTAITWLNVPWWVSQYSQLMYHTGTYLIEDGAYMGIPLITLTTVACWKLRSRPITTTLIIIIIVSCLMAFGPTLYWGNNALPIPLPNLILQHIPGFDDIAPIHFMMFVWLGTALMLGSWVSEPSNRTMLKWMAITLACLFILPSFSRTHRPWFSHINMPELIQDRSYMHMVQPGGSIMILDTLPHTASAMRWQISSGMYFHMYNGYVGYTPSDHPFPHLAKTMNNGHFDQQSTQELRMLIQQFHLKWLLITPETYRHYPFMFQQLPGTVKFIQGMWVYHF